MIKLRTDGYYVSKLPDIYIESHGGASGEIKLYHFIKFYADDFFAKYSHEQYYQKYDQLVDQRVVEYRDDPSRCTNVIVTVGKHYVDDHQVL